VTEIEFKMADVPVCDFCGSPSPQWEYSALDFVDGAETPLPQKSIGGWLACDRCAQCIQQNDWHGLAERGLLNPAAKLLITAAGRDQARSMIQEFHSKFRRYRNRKVISFKQGSKGGV
jgi:hypothetical protein